jgi:8-oxo-dGTP pyrophosphatase MutT (NUDIX family)
VYKRDNQKNKKLDFSKGKADEGESDMDCAAREI